MAGIFCEGFEGYGAFADFTQVHGTGGNSGTWTFPSSGRFDSLTVMQGGQGFIANMRGFPAVTVGATFFVHAACFFGVTTDTPSTHSILDLREISGARVHLRISRPGPDSIEIYRRTTLLESASIAGVLSNNSWHVIQIKGNIHDSTGSYEVKVDGVVVLSDSGIDTRDAGSGDFDELRVSCNTAFPNTSAFDDLVIWNTVAGGPTDYPPTEFRVSRLQPSGAGNSADFTPQGQTNNWENLDKSTVPTALGSDFNESNVVTNKDTVAMDDTSLTGDPQFIQVRYLGLKDGGGARSVEGVLRSGGGTEAQGAVFALGTGLEAHFDVFDVEPGGAAWTNTKVDAIEAGYQVQA